MALLAEYCRLTTVLPYVAVTALQLCVAAFLVRWLLNREDAEMARVSVPYEAEGHSVDGDDSEARSPSTENNARSAERQRGGGEITLAITKSTVVSPEVPCQLACVPAARNP